MLWEGKTVYNTKDNGANSADRIKAMRQRTGGIERDGFYWSEAERQQLKTDYENGVGLSEIAAELQRTETAVVQQLIQLDVVKKTQRRRSKQEVCLCGKCLAQCEKYTKT